MTDEVDLLYQHTRESAQKFEYFLLGITLALLAFEGKTLASQRLGLNAYTVEIAAVIVLVCSVIAGFKHIEAMIETSAINHVSLTAESKRSRIARGEFMYENFTGKELTADEKERAMWNLRQVVERCDAEITKVIAKSDWWCRARMWLLLAGFVLLISAKISEPYLR